MIKIHADTSKGHNFYVKSGAQLEKFAYGNSQNQLIYICCHFIWYDPFSEMCEVCS